MLEFLGNFYGRRRQWVLVERCWARLVELAPGPPRLTAHLGLAQVHHAREAWREVIPHTDQALAILKEWERGAPPDAPNPQERQVLRARALTYRGEALRHLGEPELAANAYIDALQLEARDDQTRGLARLGLAKLYFAKKRLDDAHQQALFAAVVERGSPQQPEAMLFLALVAHERRQPDEARQQVQRMRQLFPAEYNRLSNLAEYRERLAAILATETPPAP